MRTERMLVRVVVTRVLWGLLIALQICLGSVATVIEARLSNGDNTPDSELHVESTGTIHGTPFHPVACTFCQYLNATGNSKEYADFPRSWVISSVQAFGAQTSAYRSTGRSSVLPRAPPLC